MIVKPATTFVALFTLRNPDGSGLVNADDTPTVIANLNGVDSVGDGSWVLTVSNIETGRYKFSGTVPDYADGDILSFVIAATVNGVTEKIVVGPFLVQTKYVTDLHDVAATDIVSNGAITTVSGVVSAVGSVNGGVALATSQPNYAPATAGALATAQTAITGIATTLTSLATATNLAAAKTAIDAIKAELDLVKTQSDKIGTDASDGTAATLAYANINTLIDNVATALTGLSSLSTAVGTIGSDVDTVASDVVSALMNLTAINNNVLSRLANADYTAPDNANISAIYAALGTLATVFNTRIPGVVAAQTGDSFARIGVNGAGLTAISGGGGGGGVALSDVIDSDVTLQLALKMLVAVACNAYFKDGNNVVFKDRVGADFLTIPIPSAGVQRSGGTIS